MGGRCLPRGSHIAWSHIGRSPGTSPGSPTFWGLPHCVPERGIDMGLHTQPKGDIGVPKVKGVPAYHTWGTHGGNEVGRATPSELSGHPGGRAVSPHSLVMPSAKMSDILQQEDKMRMLGWSMMSTWRRDGSGDRGRLGQSKGKGRQAVEGTDGIADREVDSLRIPALLLPIPTPH